MHALLALATVFYCLLLLCLAYGVARVVLTLRDMSARLSSALAGVRK